MGYISRFYAGGGLDSLEVLIAQWKKEYNQTRTDRSLRYHPLAPEASLKALIT